MTWASVSSYREAGACSLLELLPFKDFVFRESGREWEEIERNINDVQEMHRSGIH